MSDNAPRTDSSERPYTVSAPARARLTKRQTRHWRQLQGPRQPSERRYWVLSLRARQRNPIRGYLVTHRRMFGVSHKSVQPGERNGQLDG